MAAILSEICVTPPVAEKSQEDTLSEDVPEDDIPKNDFAEDYIPENYIPLKEDDKITLSPPLLNSDAIKKEFQNKVMGKSNNAKKERIKPCGSGRRLSYATQTDANLLRWVKDLQENKINVTREMLQRQALALIQLECPDFKASSGWVEKFLVRHGITLPGMCRNFNHLSNDKADGKKNGEHAADRMEFSNEPVIREPPNLSELLNNVNANSPVVKDEDDDNDDEDDDDADENDVDGRKNPTEIHPERLKAFNMFVRLFVDENLDRLVPISKQPKEKINAIILSCQRQFPEFSERARKRIRTYLKSCRRSSRLKEPLKRTSDNMSSATAHIPSTQLAEVNACYNESEEVSKRARLEGDAHDTSTQPKHQEKHSVLHLAPNHPVHLHSHDRHGQKYMPFSSASRTPPVKLSSSEIAAVRQLVSGYRESAAFLYRSADELENLLRQSEQYYGQQQQQQQHEHPQ